jgi:hypothetical protein
MDKNEQSSRSGEASPRRSWWRFSTMLTLGLVGLLLPGWSLLSPMIAPGELDRISLALVAVFCGLVGWRISAQRGAAAVYAALLFVASLAGDRASAGTIRWISWQQTPLQVDLEAPPDWSAVRGVVSVAARLVPSPVLDEYQVEAGQRPDQDVSAGFVVARLVPKDGQPRPNADLVLVRLAANYPRKDKIGHFRGIVRPIESRVAVALVVGGEGEEGDAHVLDPDVRAWLVDTDAAIDTHSWLALALAGLCSMMAIGIAFQLAREKGERGTSQPT